MNSSQEPLSKASPSMSWSPHISCRVSPAQLRAGWMDQASLNARAQASHWQDDPLESETPKSGGSSPPASAWLLLSIPQPQISTYLTQDSGQRSTSWRLRPKPYWQTPLPSLVPITCSLISCPCQWLVAQSSNPSHVISQTSHVFPTFWFWFCIWPYLPDSQLCPGTVCPHTLFSFINLRLSLSLASI